MMLPVAVCFQRHDVRHKIWWRRPPGERETTRMWANAQRDGRPAEYRWRPLFNAAKFGWRPLPEWRAVTLPRRESHWNLLGHAPNSGTDLSR